MDGQLAAERERRHAVVLRSISEICQSIGEELCGLRSDLEDFTSSESVRITAPSPPEELSGLEEVKKQIKADDAAARSPLLVELYALKTGVEDIHKQIRDIRSRVDI